MCNHLPRMYRETTPVWLPAPTAPTECTACSQYMRRLPALGLILKLDEASSTLSTAVTSDEDAAVAAAAAGPISLSFMLPQALRGEQHYVITGRCGGYHPEVRLEADEEPHRSNKPGEF